MKKFLVLLAALALPCGAAAPPCAALQVDVTQGNAQPLPIAIPDFLPAVRRPQAGANIAGVVRADLERSGLFRPLDPKAFVEHITDINKVPTFANWRSITAQGLVTGPGGAAARRTAAGGFPAVGCLWRKPDAGPAILHHAGELAAHRPYGVGRHL